MSRALVVLCATLLATAIAGAQTVQSVHPIKLQPVQPAPAASDAIVASPAQDPMQPVETIDSLKAANKQLRENNKLLRAENASLKDKLAAITTRGGSQVRAYCPTGTTSRNTAGAEADCAASGYTCEDVSGLCRTTCQSSDMCAGGYTCDVGAGRCIYTAGGVPGSGG
jgi:cell division protein FtsB